MKASPWVLWLSGRWFSARKESGGAASSVLAAAGIAIGVTALVVVLGVMNGFQMGYIDSILEVASYHVRVPSEPREQPDPELAARLSAEPGVRAAVPFTDTQVLLGSKEGVTLPSKLRAIPFAAAAGDPGFPEALGLDRDALASSSSGIVLGAELARYLNVAAGDSIEVLVIRADSANGLETRSAPVRVARVFRSGFYEYDSGLAFLDVSLWTSLIAPGERPRWTFGLKLADRDSAPRLASRLGAEGFEGAESWKDFNRSFFGALRTEKTMMMLLVGLIFIVVGVNIYQSMRRNVFERLEEMALVKALGGATEELRRIFVLDGLAIGAAGSVIGLALGLLIAVNVNGIFAALGDLLNAASSFFAALAGKDAADFSIFSPEYFYLMEVPVRVLFPETFLIVAAAVGSASGAAAIAASQVSSLEPAELLRHE